MRTPLAILDVQIEARCRTTQQAHPYWPCARGCDHCCRSLAQLPQLTPPEWQRLAPAIDALHPDVKAAVRTRLAAAPDSGPVVCPLLDLDRGECRVYDARPIACRTYGFYTDPDAGLHCDDVLEAVRENGDEHSVIWGNAASLKDKLREHGEARSLAACMLDTR
jgi:uncharacterized protein